MNSHSASKNLSLRNWMQIKSVRSAVYATLAAAVTVGLAACHDDDFDYPNYDVPNSVAVIDMNGDGVSDIVFAATHIDGGYPNPGFAGVILQNPGLGQGNGTFQTANYTSVGYNPSTLAIGNFDGASGPDVVVANANSANVSVLLHDAAIPNAQLQAARTVTTGGVPYDVAVGDLNNDSLPDIAMASVGGNSNNVVLLMRSTVPGEFLAPVTLPVSNPATSVAVGDLNGDGRADIAVANVASGGAGYVTVFFQQTNGTIGAGTSISAGTEPISVKIGNLNSDAFPDLVVANEGPGSNGAGTSGATVLLQDPATPRGRFLSGTTYATARGSVCVATGDVNNDGFEDIVVANTGGSRTGTVSVLLQDAMRSGSFLSATNYPGVYEPLGVAIGNLNGDTLPDIAVADGSRATVMFNSTVMPGTFAGPVRVGR